MASTGTSLPPYQSISSSTFNQTWSPSAANAFDVSTLPIRRAHKAWERRPQAPRNQAAKYKKVWKTYGLRSTHDSHDDAAGAETENDRARAVKRMCINDKTAQVASVVKTKLRRNYAGTKFDRRRSGITRKTRVFRDEQDLDHSTDEQAMSQNLTALSPTAKPEFDEADNTDSGERSASLGYAPTAIRKRKPLGRHSLGANRGARRSLGTFAFGSIPEEPATVIDTLCLSPRKKRQPWLRTHEEPASMQAEGVKRSRVAREDESRKGADEEPPITEPESLKPAAQEPESVITTTNDLEKAGPLFDASHVDASTESVQHPKDAEEPAHIQVQHTSSEPTLDTEPFTTEVERATEELPSWADETTTHLDLDTALLKDFLSRTAAAKATRIESGGRLSLPRRASLQNRRDSDAIRMALASPRKPLDDKDPNSPVASPIKMVDLPGVKGLAAQLDAITGGPLGSRLADGDDDDTTISGTGSRRSARQRSRLPGPPSHDKTPNKISVKRTDGSDPVVMRKTEAQELSLLTRSNTRRNKGTSLARLARLKKLKSDGLAEHWTEGNVKELAAMNTRADAAEGVSFTSEAQDELPGWKVPAPGEKGVRWKSSGDLLSVFGAAASLDGASGASMEDVACKIPVPSSLEALPTTVLSAQEDIDSPRKKAQPARMRRLRGLGAANGTPGKGLLSSASLLPDDVTEEERSKLLAPRERKSRIAAPTPKKLKLAVKGEENGPSMLKAPEVGVPQAMSMAAAPSLPAPTIVGSKEVSEARERRLASPKKIPQFASGLTALSAAGTRRKRM